MFYLYYLLIENEEDCNKFDSIVEEYESMMYRAAFAVTRDAVSAQEALQSALVSIARNISRIETDNPAMLKSYIYTIAENAGIDAWRRKKREERVCNIDDYVNIPSDGNCLDDILRAEYINTLVKMIDKMPVIYREVLILNLLHEHSLCQISDELGRKYSTVRKQLERGKKILIKQIKEAKLHE